MRVNPSLLQLPSCSHSRLELDSKQERTECQGRGLRASGKGMGSAKDKESPQGWESRDLWGPGNLDEGLTRHFWKSSSRE